MLIRLFFLAGLCSGLLPLDLQAQDRPAPFPAGATREALRISGLAYSDAEIDSALGELYDNLAAYQALRNQHIPNSVPPALVFNPRPTGYSIPEGKSYLRTEKLGKVELPADSNELAWYSINQLAELLRAGKITSTRLTRFFLNRLKLYGPKLQCVITITETLALEQARVADLELAAGEYRGLLHGIPYGIKDLFAAKTYPTTWGAAPYQAQVFEEDAAVVKALHEAGAVLIGKLTLGELAMGDTWFGGTTKNPRNPAEGSSGSSAGSAAAVAAGLVPFAIGTETLGSIVSPSTVCGVTGLRPTFGRIDRTGAMALSWSMDKVGPIARSAEDCAIVFTYLYDHKGEDPAHQRAPFAFDVSKPITELKVGYLQQDFQGARQYPFRLSDSLALAQLRALGVQLVPIELPALAREDITFLLLAEAAAAFDELTLTGQDSLLKQQGRYAWPSLFRSARLIPAVEYIQANRLRFSLIQQVHAMLEDAKVDLFLAPSWASRQLVVTNLTGHPTVVLPTGFDTSTLSSSSICIIGRLYEEGNILQLAHAYQLATGWDELRPDLTKLK
jgi:Asp-tRNA(Asn)/Glu-tRNA(Gln) amidotransferase A subunit family amidase